MPLTSVSTYASHQNFLRDLSRTQLDLGNLQNQVSSGFQSDSYEGLSGQVELFTSLNGKIQKSLRYEENNKIAQARINVAGTAIDQSVNTATDLKNLILLQRNSSLAGSLAFDVQIDSHFKALASQFNTNMEGRYLFSGTRTDVKAIDDTKFPTLKVPGVPDDSYYQGSSEDVTLRADEDFDVKYSVRANDPSVQKLMAGLAMAKEGAATKNDALLAKAYEFIDQGQQGLIGVKNKLDATKVQLDSINDRHQSKRLYWTEVTEGQTKTDIVSATTQISINQAMLQASFQVFSRLASLKLVDFLR